jgi:polyisoprenoid-binding protein YceI
MSRLLSVAMMLVLASATRGQAGATHLAMAPRSILVLTGSSNLSQWQCRGAALQGTMDVDASIEKINDVIDRVEDGNMSVWMSEPSAGRFPQPRFELTIPVDTLRCSGGRRMEHDMRNALKADRNPVIRFRFVEVSGAIAHDMDEHLYHAAITGRLSLAGVERDIEVSVSAQRVARDRFRLRTVLPLRMSDFGIVRPTALFGLIHANDDLTVEFDLILEVATDA